MIGIAFVASWLRNRSATLVAVELRHRDVDQGQVRRALESLLQSTRAVGSTDDLVAVALQAKRDEIENVGVVVGDEHERPLAHDAISSRAGAAGCTARIGMVTRKVAPSPSLLASVIRPPCACTIALEIASPSPVP